jgi:Ca2+-transporting ATPase
MSSIRNVDGKTIAYVKGAPNELLARCTQIDNGKFIKKITASDIKIIQAAIDESSSNAMRNIGFAYKEIENYNKDISMEETENNLIFTGFVAIIDPPREEVPEAVKAARDAKIKIIMITGDYGPTAEAIADKIGLDGDGKMILIPGDDLRKMSDIHLSNTIKSYRSLIFSRTSPEDKLRIVNLLKKTHNVVAVTGDGINDAPALKCADIGVAMGKIGTDVAKESSEIVLLDDSFHTLV